MSELSELIATESVRLDVEAADWREAIRVAGALLVDAGIAGESYTEAMLRSVDEHGPYIVITPGFAFAHARPDDSVRRTGMSLIRLARPLEFGHETNDPVTLVLALAAVDSDAHRSALAQLARLLGDPGKRQALDQAQDPQEVRAILGTAQQSGTATTSSATAKNLIYTVCGNGLGTSLFLKNTLEQVLDHWKWSKYVTVEATDTISARGKAKDADFILTSGEIARTLGDVGVPVEVIENFTSKAEVDAALRRLYDV